jgi:hypothetical protein
MKFILKLALIISSSLCIFQNANSEECSTDGLMRKGLVKDLYINFGNHKNDSQGIIDQKKAVIGKYFDQKLSMLIMREGQCRESGEICNLDFDPIYNSQDPVDYTASYFCDKNNINVLINHSKKVSKANKSIKVVFTFKNVNNTWKIDDLLYSDGSSLQKILQ